MNTHRVESIQLKIDAEKAFSYIANPANLPNWAKAFQSVKNGRATMATLAGSVEVGLQVNASAPAGTIDWHMTFPDRTVASAYSRVVPDRDGRSVYSFVLMAPPVPLEKLEGALEQQVHTLREELSKLGAILKKG